MVRGGHKPSSTANAIGTNVSAKKTNAANETDNPVCQEWQASALVGRRCRFENRAQDAPFPSGNDRGSVLLPRGYEGSPFLPNPMEACCGLGVRMRQAGDLGFGSPEGLLSEAAR